MGVWQEADGSAYLVRSVDNEYLGISPLSPDYTTTVGLVSTGVKLAGCAVRSIDAKAMMSCLHLPACLTHQLAQAVDCHGPISRICTVSV